MRAIARAARITAEQSVLFPMQHPSPICGVFQLAARPPGPNDCIRLAPAAKRRAAVAVGAGIVSGGGAAPGLPSGGRWPPSRFRNYRRSSFAAPRLAPPDHRAGPGRMAGPRGPACRYPLIGRRAAPGTPAVPAPGGRVLAARLAGRPRRPAPSSAARGIGQAPGRGLAAPGRRCGGLRGGAVPQDAAAARTNRAKAAGGGVRDGAASAPASRRRPPAGVWGAARTAGPRPGFGAPARRRPRDQDRVGAVPCAIRPGGRAEKPRGRIDPGSRQPGAAVQIGVNLY